MRQKCLSAIPGCKSGCPRCCPRWRETIAPGGLLVRLGPYQHSGPFKSPSQRRSGIPTGPVDGSYCYRKPLDSENPPYRFGPIWSVIAISATPIWPQRQAPCAALMWRLCGFQSPGPDAARCHGIDGIRLGLGEGWFNLCCVLVRCERRDGRLRFPVR